MLTASSRISKPELFNLIRECEIGTKQYLEIQARETKEDTLIFYRLNDNVYDESLVHLRSPLSISGKVNN